jgi:hypothetical protein
MIPQMESKIERLKAVRIIDLRYQFMVTSVAYINV